MYSTYLKKKKKKIEKSQMQISGQRKDFPTYPSGDFLPFLLSIPCFLKASLLRSHILPYDSKGLAQSERATARTMKN